MGDGEPETGPLATSWHINKFLNPIKDGAVLPVLHLNGYKIANPSILSRIDHAELESLFRGLGWTPIFVEGSDPLTMHRTMAMAMEQAVLTIRAIQEQARSSGDAFRPRWPMIVLRSPKGWTGPQELDGKKIENFWRAHQVPIGDVKTNPEHLQLLEDWMKSYRPWGSLMTTAPYARRFGPCLPGVIGAWAATPTATVGCCAKTCASRSYGPTRCPWRAPAALRKKTPIPWAN